LFAEIVVIAATEAQILSLIEQSLYSSVFLVLSSDFLAVDTT
jgi:hypothetical protein